MGAKKTDSGNLEKYDESSTENLAKAIYYDARMDIVSLLRSEGYDNKEVTLPRKCPVIYMDKVVKKRTKGNQPKSVDIVFVCENQNLVLAECKFRVKKAYKIKVTELKAKTVGSKNALNQYQPEYFENYGSPVYILVSDSIFHQAERALREGDPKKYGQGEKSPQFLPLKVSDFMALFF